MSKRRMLYDWWSIFILLCLVSKNGFTSLKMHVTTDSDREEHHREKMWQRKAMPSDLLESSCETDLVINKLEYPDFLFSPDSNTGPLPRKYMGNVYNLSEKLNASIYNILPSHPSPHAEGHDVLLNFNLEKQLHVTDCEMDGDLHAFRRTIQRVGPFSSYGGYDFWELRWNNLAHTRETLAKHKDGISITGLKIGPVSNTGDDLGLPPLHVHHMNVGPDLFGFSIDSMMNECHIQTIGDAQCMPEFGGSACMTPTFPNGHAWILKKPWSVEALLNDVRSPNSELLEWWLHIDFTWTPKDFHNLKPISFYIMANPWDVVNTFPVFTNEFSIMWWTTIMPRSGSLVRGWFHSHAAVSTAQYFFSATPNHLGLNNFPPSIPKWKPITLSQTGFSSMTQLTDHIFTNLRKEIRSHHASCGGGGLCNGTLPRLICSRHSEEEEVNGVLYDRSIPQAMQCSSWTFKKGESVTGLFLNRPLSSKSMSLEGIRSGKQPKTFNQHGVFNLFYTAEDLDAHYDFHTHSQMVGIPGGNDIYKDDHPRMTVQSAYLRE